MARWITGLTVERRRVTVRAQGTVSPPECATDPDDCCSEAPDADGGVGGSTCCPEAELSETTPVVASGPLGTGGAACEVTFDVTRDAELDPHEWLGEGLGTGGDCDDVRVSIKVWFALNDEGECEWFVGGESWDQGGTRRSFGPVLMDDDGTDLTAEAFLPGLEGTLSLTVERPCAPLVTWDLVGDACVMVVGGGGRYASEAECEAAHAYCGDCYFFTGDFTIDVCRATDPPFVQTWFDVTTVWRLDGPWVTGVAGRWTLVGAGDVACVYTAEGWDGCTVPVTFTGNGECETISPIYLTGYTDGCCPE